MAYSLYIDAALILRAAFLLCSLAEAGYFIKYYRNPHRSSGFFIG